ncbi:MAG TPA: 4a-hydroxytetrahydrobiopterin dehydratase [Edaphocola sp.]|nr:4a-hydroxytetrahydrobiopterin dehydratase [Edaphocola sp.]
MNYKEIDGKLVWELEKENQTAVAQLVLNIAKAADALDHHPDMLIHKWNHLRIELFSHDVNAITEKDYQLAERIEALL